MPQLSQLMQLYRDEKAKWNNSPKLMDLLMRDSSTEGIRQYAGNVQQRGATLAGLLQGREPTDAQKALFSIANPSTPEGALDMVGVGHTAWHGTPHLFDKFDLGKIGTGEGAQVYGHGQYLAESQGVAKQYADNVKDMGAIGDINTELSRLAKIMHADESGEYGKYRTAAGRDAKKQYDELMGKRDSVRLAPGNMYKTDIPDSHLSKMLDWDKPLSEQSQHVQDALRKANPKHFSDAANADYSAGQYYDHMSRGPGADYMSSLLQANGIPGIKYLDGSSRAGGEGTSNFVMFNPDDIRILERNGVPTGQKPWNSK